MALFLDRRSGQTVPSKLREVFPDLDVAVPKGCPVYVLDESDAEWTESGSGGDDDDSSDDVSFYDAVEDFPPPLKHVPLPEEILDGIMRNVEALDGGEATLEACSLVCHAWSLPARRRLLAGSLRVRSADSAQRLREILEAHPELRQAVQNVNLTTPMRNGLIAPFYRRAAVLLRRTPNVQTLQLLHAGLSLTNRRRLYSALRLLPLTRLSLYSSSWPISHFGQNIEDHADTRDALRLLCEWTDLEYLTLSGYSSYPRLLLPEAAPAHAFPTYRLRELHLLSCSLAESALLWLLGNSAKTLKQLNLGGCSGLTSEVLADVFAAVGSTLETLIISLDVEDITGAPVSQPIRSDVVKNLLQLRSINVSTDSVFTEDLILILFELPMLESVSLCYPAFTHAVVKEALATLPPASKLARLFLDAWDSPEAWTLRERWEIMQACEKRSIKLILNGLVKSDIEDGKQSLPGLLD
ncbi:hypothetical protein JCM3774_006477 [Rhodotorula dairenensis]